MTKNLVVMLDSGAFTARKKNHSIDIEEYAAFCHEHRRLFRGGVFNLDVIDMTPRTFSRPYLRPFGKRLVRMDPVPSPINVGASAKDSYENWLKLRSLGVDSIPVFHIGEDEQYLRHYLDQTDYIAIGSISELRGSNRIYGMDYIWHKYLMHKNGTAKYRVHGLGLNDRPLIARYPWFSLDALTGVATAAYGNIFVPDFTATGYSLDRFYVMNISIHARNQTVNHFASGFQKLKSRSFFTLPKAAQARVREFVEARGFTLEESLEGRTVMPKLATRKRTDAEWAPWLSGLPELDALMLANGNGNGNGTSNAAPSEDAALPDDSERNVSRSFDWRAVYNWGIIDEFARHWRRKGRVFRIYNVVGGGRMFNLFVRESKAEPASRCLISYFRMSDNILARLREEVHGNQMR